jgi:hypothetical protein
MTAITLNLSQNSTKNFALKLRGKDWNPIAISSIPSKNGFSLNPPQNLTYSNKSILVFQQKTGLNTMG